MSNFDAWWALCMRPDFDGRADDSADDGAGETRWGWTIPTWAAARTAQGSNTAPAEFVAMTKEDAGALALAYIWPRFGGPKLRSGHDVAVVDWCWTSGHAILQIEARLGRSPADRMDSDLIDAINAKDWTFAMTVHSWRVSYFDSLGFRTRFRGLYTRCAAVLALSMELEHG